jgi:error-prone DNA polymerase
MQFLRTTAAPRVSSVAQLQAMEPGGQVETAGLVVCRQRPGTAHGIVFLLLEDETGLANVTVYSDLYESHRTLVRTEPLLRVSGVLQGHAGRVPMLRALRLEPLTREHHLAMPEGKSWG